MTTRINKSFATFAAILVVSMIICLTAGSTALASPYSDAVLGDAPLAYWRLGDAGNPVVDIAGGNNGTADAGVAFGQPSLLIGDPVNTSIRTVGTNRVVVPGFEKFPGGSTGFTTEYWITANAFPATFSNIVGDGEAGGDFYMMNYLSSGGNIRPHFSVANVPVSMDSVGTLNLGQPTYVVTTWDQVAGSASIYINGVLDSTIPVSTNIPSNSNNQMYLGRDDREPGGDFILDEVAFYNRPLSGSEIFLHFQAASQTASAVPEPSTFLLGVLATLVLGAFGWRRGR